MNRLLPLLSLALLVTLAACGDVGDAPRATVEAADADAPAEAFSGTALAIDTSRSEITWLGAKVTGTHDGGFRVFDGAVYRDGDTVTGVELTIDATSIWSDNDRLTGHLKSGDFFEVETYPEATFRADAFEPIAPADSVEWAEATHRVSGVLTMRGQANRITFPARIAVTEGAVEADADFLIERSRWGLSYPGKPDDLIQEEVRLRFDVAASGDEQAAPVETASVQG
jgi:polyisoprenoid-binding protein YceI